MYQFLRFGLRYFHAAQPLLIRRHTMSAAIESAFDVGIEVSPHRLRTSQRTHSARVNLAVVIVSALQADDHVLLFPVIADTGDETAPADGFALEGA